MQGLNNLTEEAINIVGSSQIQIKEQHETVKVENEENELKNTQNLDFKQNRPVHKWQTLNTRKNLLVLWCTNINQVEIFHALHDNGCTIKQADVLSMEQIINWK